MEKTRLSSIWIDNDVLEWLDDSGTKLGKNRSERIRRLLREGWVRLNNGKTEESRDAPRTDPPNYDLRLFLSNQKGLDESITELKTKHADQANRVNELSRSIKDLQRRIADISDD